MALQSVQFVEEGLIGPGLLVRGGDLFDHRHQGFGDQPSAVGAEVPLGVRVVDGGFGDGCAGTRQLRAGEIGHYLSGRVSGRTDVYLR